MLPLSIENIATVVGDRFGIAPLAKAVEEAFGSDYLRTPDRDTSSTLLSILCVPNSQALSKSVSEYGDYSDRIKVRIIYV